MRWGDAPYVRLYIEPDADFLALSWQARALFYELLKCADRTGCVKTGKRIQAGASVLTRIPEAVIAAALPELLDDGCVVESEASLVIRNFLEAQTTPRSDLARKRQERERHRDTALRHEMSRGVTKCHTITEPSRAEQNRAEHPSTTPRRAAARVAQDYSPDFLAFWAAYPSKTAKTAAWAAWQKHRPPLAACLTALAWQRQQPGWTKDGGKFIPHPATWLNAGRWTDEPPTVAPSLDSTLDAFADLPEGIPTDIRTFPLLEVRR